MSNSNSSATRTYSSCLCSASPNYSLFLFPHLLVRVVELDADVLPELVAVAEVDAVEVAATEESASETSAKMAMSSAGTLELHVGHETCAVLTIMKLEGGNENDAEGSTSDDSARVEPATEAVPCEGAAGAGGGGAAGSKSIIHMSGTTYNLDE